VSESAEDLEAFIKSLTGYDEIAIAKSFGADVEALTPGRATRALLFVRHRRSGMKDPEAYAAATAATRGELEELFTPADVLADEADAPGEDSSPGGPTP
jgi:hypothetical protein